jgi:hypothetical protein
MRPALPEKPEVRAGLCFCALRFRSARPQGFRSGLYDDHAGEPVAKGAKAQGESAKGPDDRATKKTHPEDENGKRRQLAPGNLLARVAAHVLNHLELRAQQDDQTQLVSCRSRCGRCNGPYRAGLLAISARASGRSTWASRSSTM